jgi:hypothetical protein
MAVTWFVRAMCCAKKSCPSRREEEERSTRRPIREFSRRAEISAQSIDACEDCRRGCLATSNSPYSGLCFALCG